ncbi:complement C1q-like protein 2 [Saccostrea echinata]|uniref:complement C1q-like protein 2 n=1 Tax=Saccostrea echinata TaxID=191078 RepID=UPI002A83EA57|nr:complement C1q-like protein 2 [Saccostrea echinata]
MSMTHSPLTDLKSEDNPITDVCANESLGEDIYHLKQQLNQESLIRLSLNQIPRMFPSFHARLSRSVRQIGFYQTVIFDFEVVDTTNSYDPQSGIFTAPVAGIYVFYWNILSNEASGMDTTLDSSQGSLGYGFVSHAVNYGNGGNLVIAKLTSGTNVWVKKAARYGNYIHERFSTFTGYILHASG